MNLSHYSKFPDGLNNISCYIWFWPEALGVYATHSVFYAHSVNISYLLITVVTGSFKRFKLKYKLPKIF